MTLAHPCASSPFARGRVEIDEVIVYLTEIFNRSSEREKRKLLRNNMTEAERILWHRIRNRQIHGKRFRRQFSIGPYIADFYCPELRLVIEIDGDVHLKVDAIEYDQVRDKYITSLNIKVIRFTNYEVYNNIDEVLNKLDKYCL